MFVFLTKHPSSFVLPAHCVYIHVWEVLGSDQIVCMYVRMCVHVCVYSFAESCCVSSNMPAIQCERGTNRTTQKCTLCLYLTHCLVVEVGVE